MTTDTEKPSKSSIKREFAAARDLGAELVDVSDAVLESLLLDADLVAAVRAARAMKRGARKRQLRYVGGLLAREDVRAIRQALADSTRPSHEETARFHAVEQWRDDLLVRGDAAIEALLETCPGADERRLRGLVREALEERDAGRAPRAGRQLFRMLRELLDHVD